MLFFFSKIKWSLCYFSCLRRRRCFMFNQLVSTTAKTWWLGFRNKKITNLCLLFGLDDCQSARCKYLFFTLNGDVEIELMLMFVSLNCNARNIWIVENNDLKIALKLEFQFIKTSLKYFFLKNVLRCFSIQNRLWKKYYWCLLHVYKKWIIFSKDVFTNWTCTSSYYSRRLLYECRIE